MHSCTGAMILGVVHGSVWHGFFFVDHVELVVQKMGVRHAMLICSLVLITEGRPWLHRLGSWG